MTTLILAAHPDDEALGCGGWLLKNIDEEKHIVFVADGVRSIGGGHEEKTALQLAAQAYAATFGASVDFLELPDQLLEQAGVLAITQRVACLEFWSSVDRIITHSRHDMNGDHRTVAEAATLLARPFASNVRTVLRFEIPGSQQHGRFSPTHFCELSDPDMNAKIVALANSYYAQMKPPPHPRSLKGVETLAMMRGSSVGTKYAEAFECTLSVF